jgi:transposase InsO family protein
MRIHEPIFPVTKMSKAFGVSKSGYYAWKNRKTCKRAREQMELVPVIQDIQQRNRWEYGEKRITQALRRIGKPISRNRVIRILREERLGARPKKRFRVAAASNVNSFFSPNLLNRQFSPSRPNTVWVTDITYCRCRNNFLYLCVFIDLYSRTIVGWALGKTMETSLILYALSMALNRRRPQEGLMLHSDRGVQYCSDDFRKVLADNHIVQSMSRNGNCWDNAVAESFFKTLKRELLNKQVYTSMQAMHVDLFEYLDGYYNRERLHSALDYKTPLEFEQIGA